ncbi:MAG: hypothetical protein PHG25_00280 [Candidatus Pacebacteria bacterium]|nr:hypothetical protein [Candidatus Paceibacterota bacterium]
MKTTERILVRVMPEAMSRLVWIMRQLLSTHAKILHKRVVNLDTDTVNALHPTANGQVKAEILQRLKGQQIGLFLLEGENVVEHITRLVGTDNKQYLWTINTLQGQLLVEFYLRINRSYADSVYHYHFIECVTDPDEIKRQYALLTDKSLYSKTF